ncbi:MAG: GIY-YIG nuclease family protein [Deltaproteobacteria bacterium]|nr:GIY-YIG nuclease family protein [Deltaproteobacteria bacterium]
MATMLSLLELLTAKGFDLPPKRCKVHFATTGSSGAGPFEAYLAGTFKSWQEDQSHRNFKREFVVSLIQLHRARWLFAGVWRVLGVEPNGRGGFTYRTEAVEQFNPLVGRVIVTFEKKFRQSYPYAETCLDKLQVTELRPEKMSVREFPGFDSVSVSFDELSLIVRDGVPSWKSVLSSFGGIYLIVDSSTGKQYVGQAPGQGGIWQRWSAYAETGHGGNVELRDLLRDNGKEHARRFRFVLLEVADRRAATEYMVAREKYWKDSLLTREFGLNRN